MPILDVERAALGNVPANFYESICVPVPDLRDFLTGGGASSNNNTASNNTANNNNHNNNGANSNEAAAPPPPPAPAAPPAAPATPATQQQQAAALPPPPKLIRAPHLARPAPPSGVTSYLEGKLNSASISPFLHFSISLEDSTLFSLGGS